MTCNMNERTVQPSLLVLSRAVYAKRQQDSTFHSGSVETKLPDGRFMVHFTDGSCEKVPERNITWLGFWGLPPSSWPTRPIVNIAGHLNELDSATTQDHAIGKSISESCPGLIKTIGNTHTASYPAETHFNTVNEKANDLRCAIDHTRKTDVSKIDSAIFFKKSLKHDTPRVLPDNLSANQRRLSVLRICHVDKSKKNLVIKKQENPNDVETDHGPSAIKRSPPLKEETITRKRKASPEYFVKNQKFEHISPYLSQIYQKYGEAFHISTCPDTRVNVVPKSFRVESRPKKRSENKKCRKVYGIENRDIWCTQCKWKKACSRFATNDKTDPSMMYITGHDAMHCPV